jgi:regulatory protein
MAQVPKPTKLTPKQAQKKIEHFCAYRERSQVEVREKLYHYGLIPPEVEALVTGLIEGNFLNEERFAMAYVRGKFEQKKWGRVKIKQGLYPHKISDYLLRKAFKQISEIAYAEVLSEVVAKKYKTTKAPSAFNKKGKVAAYAISRGFEAELVWEEMKKYQ